MLFSGLMTTNVQAVPPSIIESEASTGATAKVEVHDEYIHGEPILIPIQLHNPGPGRISVPDLATRPWLVHFQLVLPTGHDQLRKNPPAPDEDQGTMVSVAQRGNRHVLLGNPFQPKHETWGYEVQIQIHLNDEVVTLPAKHTLPLVPALPVASDFGGYSNIQEVHLKCFLHCGYIEVPMVIVSISIWPMKNPSTYILISTCTTPTTRFRRCYP